MQCNDGRDNDEYIRKGAACSLPQRKGGKTMFLRKKKAGASGENQTAAPPQAGKPVDPKEKGMHSLRRKVCVSCGKQLKMVNDGAAFPSEWIPDTLSALCPNCSGLLCHDCRQYLGKCPNCGCDTLFTVDAALVANYERNKR